MKERSRAGRAVCFSVCLILVLVMSVGLAGMFSVKKVHAEELMTSGTCGTAWSLSEDGVLTIEAGEMDDWGAVPPWYSYCEKIKSVKTTGKVVLKTAHWMFEKCSALTRVDLSSFDTSQVTDMQGMFECCAVEALDVSGFDTTNVTSMRAMFWGTHLTELDLSSFRTSNVTTMHGMFGLSRQLKSVNLSGFDTSGVTDMSEMFYGCKALQSLDLSSFDTSHVKKMEEMFLFCKKMRKLDISSFDMSSIEEEYDETYKVWMSGVGAMFYGCSGLKELKLGKWSTYNHLNGPSGFPVPMKDTETGQVYLAGECMPKVDGHTFVRVYLEDQPMKASASKQTLKASTLKKKSVTVRPIRVKHAKGKVTYKASKGTKASYKALKLSEKTGAVTVRKGTPKGTYKLRVIVKAAGNRKYKPGTQKVTVIVVVN